MSNLQIAEVKTAAEGLLTEAKTIHAEILAEEAGLLNKRDALLMLGYRFGEKLSAIKQMVGHGKWLQWLEGHWPELGERTVQRCIALFRENEANPRNSTDLTQDSIRKFMWGYVPEKDRPALEGDQRLTPPPHYLTVLNTFNKWQRQIETGAAKLEREEAKRDLRPVFEWMCSLYGITSPL